jgi:hypothetical protein
MSSDLPFSKSEIISMIRGALESKNFKEEVPNIQTYIWGSEANQSELTENETEVLNELAYDLEYFVSNPVHRAEDPSYFGNDRAEKELLSALKQLESKQ